MNEEQYFILDHICFSSEELFDYNQFVLRVRAEKEVYEENNADNTEMIDLFEGIVTDMNVQKFKEYVKFRQNGVGSMI